MQTQEGLPDARERVVGSYVLERRLGSGATGEVWLGWHPHTESLAAVKLLEEHPALRGRARRERHIIGRLSYSNVINLYEVGPDHIAMTYGDGPNPTPAPGGEV
ncbi:MAG: hypothetical protein IPM35_33095 [Myxococcales bacterium]|nr:hypothetical protein [Myxococcales bacterium]